MKSIQAGSIKIFSIYLEKKRKGKETNFYQERKSLKNMDTAEDIKYVPD